MKLQVAGRVAVSLAFVMSVAACADSDSIDDDLTNAVDLTGKADAPSFAGTYQLTGGGQRKGDLVDLQLASDQSYVRLRCYTTNCTKTVAETDHYRLYQVQSTHKTYVAFERFAWDDWEHGVQHQVTVDTYEIKAVTGGVALRKTYTSRWITLKRKTDQALCGSSGGTWDATMDFDGAEAGTTTHCNCGQDPNKWPSPAFVPGAGGCIATPAMGEAECDDTQGHYTDDDTDKLGDFCLCPAGTHATAQGCVAL